MSQHDHDSDIAALTAALGGLSPAPPALDRDRLLYEAGRRSARSRTRIWPAAAAVFAVTTAVLGVKLTTMADSDSQPRMVQLAIRAPDASPAPETVARPIPQRGSEFENRSTAGYLQLRDQVVRFGAESLPSAVPGRGAALPPIESMLGLPAGTLSDWQKSRWQSQLSRGDV